MFKNTLFLKIVLVFTLPALGMLYFSTVLVYEKIQILSELNNVKSNIRYLSAAENLVHSVQKERGYSVTYLTSKKFRKELDNQRKQTDLKYSDFVNIISTVPLDNSQMIYSVKKIQNAFYRMELLRKDMDRLLLPTFDVLVKFNTVNELLLDSIVSISPVQYASDFNTKLSSMIKLLNAKEFAGIERALTSMVISNNYIVTDDIYNYLVKLYTVQEINLKEFQLKADILEVNKYNSTISLSTLKDIEKVRASIKKHSSQKLISTEEWWDLSTSRIDSLQKVIQFSTVKILILAKKLEAEAYVAEFLSLGFLMVSFLTLISLFFVLKNIIFNEQKSFNKISKQQKVYDMLNNINKITLNQTDEKKLFNEICSLIVKDTNMSFGFIANLNEHNEVEIVASEGLLKDYLMGKVDANNKSKKHIGLLRQSYIQKSNFIVDNIVDEKISSLADVAARYNLKSAAALPIKKFGEIVSVLVIYSNQSKFFDKEIEILFNKMISDISYSLEKIEYEHIRLEQENELRIASYAFESHEAMLITDSDVNIINANKAFSKTSGYGKEEIIGKKPKMFKSTEHDDEFYKKMWDKIIKNGSWTGEIYNKRKNGEITPFRATITAIKDKEGVSRHYIAQYIDISEQKEKQQVLEYQATHDNLTGLPNRLLLLDRINHALIKVSRHGIVGGLVFIDLDNFKKMNDTLGHEVGDQLLIEVALKLRETVREEDTIARIGGDEFIILADNIGNNNTEAKENMITLSNKVKDGLNSIKTISGHKNISTPSIGVTLFNDATIGVNEIIKQADAAMYTAKRGGKNAIEFF